MKRILIIPALLLALVLPGCGSGGTDLRQLLSISTTTFQNPVGPKNIYQVKLTFNLTVKGANKWADFCWSKTYRALMIDPVGSVVCENRRNTRRVLSASADKANAAIKTADTFIRNNPTFSPLSVIDDAWRAVTDYKSLVTPIAP